MPARRQVFHHRALGDEDRHPSGNEERRHQAEQDMFLGIPFGQGQGLDHRMAETGVIHGQEEEEQKTADDHASGFQTACQSMRLGASDSVAGVPAAFCAGPSEITSLIWHPPGLVRDHQGILIPQARTKLSYIVIYSYMKAKKKTQFLFRISKRSILSIPSSNPETSGSSFNQWRRLPKMDAAKGLWRPSARV